MHKHKGEDAHACLLGRVGHNIRLVKWSYSGEGLDVVKRIFDLESFHFVADSRKYSIMLSDYLLNCAFSVIVYYGESFVVHWFMI